MTAAITVDDRFLVLAERGARVRKHAVGQRGVGAHADRPGDRKPVVAVDDGRRVRLARRDGELRQIRDPQHVRPLGVEIAVHEVGWRLGRPALVRAVPLRALAQRHHAMLGHEPHDPFGRHRHPHALQFQMDALVPVALLAVLERLLDQGQQPRVPVGPVHGVGLVMVGAMRNADRVEQAFGGHAQPLTGPLGEDGLLPAGRVFRVCARPFSQQLQSPAADRDLDVELPLLPPLPFDVGVQRVQTGLELRRVF